MISVGDDAKREIQIFPHSLTTQVHSNVFQTAFKQKYLNLNQIYVRARSLSKSTSRWLSVRFDTL